MRWVIGLGLVLAWTARGQVSLRSDALVVDGKPVPALFGAELQYFRARGGPGPNVPAATVKALWEKLLDRVQEARMNAVSLYVPWDFHEPAEGVFDFTGTLDRDGDGKPDYPSRDLRGFLDLVQRRGIRYVMIRPGPYINAEWGPEGFGAVPRWFLDRYPGSLAVTQSKGKPRTVTFADPTFRDRARRWLETLYEQVLKDYVGPGKPVVFLQIDNETNYFWDSIYERDGNPIFLARYREWLSRHYGTIDRLNAAYGTAIGDFSAVRAPTGQKDRLYAGAAWHYDWYAFHDDEIRAYYEWLRATWREIGLASSDVLFTSCDSFNAPPLGLLPRLDWRQAGGLTLTTMNIYPKTLGSEKESTLNEPMKAAHDALLVADSHRAFYGAGAHWVMSTETMGGWFPPVEVSLASRQHTYLTLVASGVRALMIYYFHEGWNWDGLEKKDTELKFDAPLDKDLAPRPAFALLRDLGERLRGPLGRLARDARPVVSPVLVAHDNAHQYPVPDAANALRLLSNDAASLFGLFREVGTLPVPGYVDGMTAEELRRFRLVVWQHPGYLREEARGRLEAYVRGGGMLVTIGDTGLRSAGSGRVVVLRSNPALGWNDDSYGKLPHAAASLAWARETLAMAGVAPSVRIAAADGEPYVHGWLSRAPRTGRVFLAVENFLRRERPVRVALAGSAVPLGARLRLTRLTGAAAEIRVSREELTGAGVGLPVASDGVDVWEIGRE